MSLLLLLLWRRLGGTPWGGTRPASSPRNVVRSDPTSPPPSSSSVYRVTRSRFCLRFFLHRKRVRSHGNDKKPGMYLLPSRVFGFYPGRPSPPIVTESRIPVENDRTGGSLPGRRTPLSVPFMNAKSFFGGKQAPPKGNKRFRWFLYAQYFRKPFTGHRSLKIYRRKRIRDRHPKRLGVHCSGHNVQQCVHALNKMCRRPLACIPILVYNRK